jgi:hypothetical protein
MRANQGHHSDDAFFFEPAEPHFIFRFRAVGLSAPSVINTALALRQAIWRKPDARWPMCGFPDTEPPWISWRLPFLEVREPWRSRSHAGGGCTPPS